MLELPQQPSLPVASSMLLKWWVAQYRRKNICSLQLIFWIRSAALTQLWLAFSLNTLGKATLFLTGPMPLFVIHSESVIEPLVSEYIFGNLCNCILIYNGTYLPLKGFGHFDCASLSTSMASLGSSPGTRLPANLSSKTLLLPFLLLQIYFACACFLLF